MKNRGKNGRETNSSRSAEYITVNIDYDKLSNAIVSAHNRIESKKRLAEEESAKAWRKNLGWADYSHERNILYQYPVVTAKQIADRTNIPVTSINRYLALLTEHRILYSDNKKRNRTYFYYDLLDILR